MNDKSLFIERIQTALVEHPFTVLSTVSEDGLPHAGTLLVLLNDDLSMHVVTKTGTLKAKNLAQHPKVAGVLHPFGPYYVQYSGDVTVVDSQEERIAIMERFAEAALHVKDFWPPIFQTTNHDYIVYRIKPTFMRCMHISPETVIRDKKPDILQLV